MSKAFDKVNIRALFVNLMKRNISVKLLRLLENITYLSQLWQMGRYPILLFHYHVRCASRFCFDTICIRTWMISAKRSRFIIVYADDFLLISSSVTDLEKLI